MGSGAKDDTIEELEKIVNENKLASKYLEDISDLDSMSNNTAGVNFKPKAKDRSKQKSEEEAGKQATIVLQEN